MGVGKVGLRGRATAQRHRVDRQPTRAVHVGPREQREIWFEAGSRPNVGKRVDDLVPVAARLLLHRDSDVLNDVDK